MRPCRITWIPSLLRLAPLAGMTMALFSILIYSHAGVVRHEYELNEIYNGPHQSSFQKLRFSIPGLIRQTCLDMAVRTGMDFQDGWQYPLEVGFVDGAPGGRENILAYVELGKMTDGSFAQRLNINLAAYERESFNLEKVFAHELVHAMLNDAIGGEAAQVLPMWFHEGLAVFGADQGEQMVKVYANLSFGTGNGMINGLEGAHGAMDYAEDYLAMKFIREKVGVSAFHNFIRDVIAKKGDIPSALQYSLFMTWDDFQEKVKQYSREQIKDLGPPRRGDSNKAY